MLSIISAWVPWVPLGLLVLGVRGGYNEAHETKTDYMHVTVYDTTTLPITHTLDLTQTCTVIVNETHTSYYTESTTSTLHFTESTTQTLHFSESTTVTYHFNTSTTSTLYYTALITNTETDSATITNTETDSATITNTETDSATITNTETDSTTLTNTATTTTTQTVPMTITTTMTQTEYTTTYDPCPSTCKVSAATVNLWFWPENRPYSYPTTYVDPSLQYTFTSPSVYMYIPTAKGVRTDGAPFGPSTSSWILPLDLYEVSTIANGSITTQLDLKDLRTDCPKTADEAEIATMLNSACDPILAAPKQVSSWAFPCNACGRFGLFDPPYAVPTATGGILGTTSTVVVVSPAPTSAAPTPTATQPVGTILVVYYSNGIAVATATILATGVSGTITSSIEVSSSAGATATGTGSGIASSSAEPGSSLSSTLGVTSTTISSLSSQTASAPTTVATAAAPEKLFSGLIALVPSLVMAVLLL